MTKSSSKRVSKNEFLLFLPATEGRQVMERSQLLLLLGLLLLLLGGGLFSKMNHPVAKGGVTPHSEIIVGDEPPCILVTLSGKGGHTISEIE